MIKPEKDKEAAETTYEIYRKQLDESEKELFKAEIDPDVFKLLDEKEYKKDFNKIKVNDND